MSGACLLGFKHLWEQQGGYHIWRATNICMSMICWGGGGAKSRVVFINWWQWTLHRFSVAWNLDTHFGWMTSHDWVDNDCWWQGTLDTGQLSLGYTHFAEITWVRLTILLNFTENSSKLYSMCRDKCLMSLRCFGSPIFSISSWQNLSRRLQDWSMIFSTESDLRIPLRLLPPGSWLEKPPHLQ